MIVAKFVDIANLLHSIKCGVQVDAIYMDILEIIRDTGKSCANSCSRNYYDFIYKNFLLGRYRVKIQNWYFLEVYLIGYVHLSFFRRIRS